MADDARIAGARLDQVATNLLAVAYGPVPPVTAAVRLRCLWAVEQLTAMGARPQRDLATSASLDVVGTLDRAVQILERLLIDDAVQPRGVALQVVAAVHEALASERC